MVRVLEPGSRTAAALEHSWQEWSGARLVAATLDQAGIAVQNLSFLATQDSGAAFQVSLPLCCSLLYSTLYHTLLQYLVLLNLRLAGLLEEVCCL